MRRLGAACLLIPAAVWLVTACNRVVSFAPNPEDLLPAGSEVLETASYTPSGRGTEYRSIYWLVSVPENGNSQESIDAIVEKLERMEFARLPAAPHDWASIALSDHQSYVAIGPYDRFAEDDSELGPSEKSLFMEASTEFGGSSVVLLFAPIPDG